VYRVTEGGDRSKTKAANAASEGRQALDVLGAIL